MNKGDLIEKVAERTGESRAGASRMVEAVIACILEGVQQQDKVAITGFGTFKRKLRRARTGMNPITKQPIEIRASTTMGFTPSETLRNGV